MMKALAPALLLLALAACAAPGSGSYSLGAGMASYDDLRRASDTCKERGGHIEPINKGGDPAQLSNYLCVIDKAKSAP